MVMESDRERKKYAAKCLGVGLRSLLAGVGFCFGLSRYTGDGLIVIGGRKSGQLLSDDFRCALCFDGVLSALRGTNGHHLSVHRTAVNMHALPSFKLRCTRRKQV